MREEYQHYRDQMKDETGRYRTRSLFWETRHIEEDKYPPLFTLKDKEHKGYPSLKKIFLSYEHLPGHEYEFAMDVFGSWEHWSKLADESTLKDYIKSWRDELEIKIRASAMKALIKNAFEDGSKGANMAKYLAEGGWRGTGRGRPSKEELQRELKVQAGVAKEFASDLERIGLVAIQGGKR
jgi:hypothetical protein